MSAPLRLGLACVFVVAVLRAPTRADGPGGGAGTPPAATLGVSFLPQGQAYAYLALTRPGAPLAPIQADAITAALRGVFGPTVRTSEDEGDDAQAYCWFVENCPL